jgi:hypothetical protein
MIITTLGLAPRRPDVATPACATGNGEVGSLGNNVLLTASYKAVNGLARMPMWSRRANF